MSRFSRNERRTFVVPYVKINGEKVDLYSAKFLYRCADCLGEIEIHNSGVRCKAQCGGRRFVTKKEAEEIKQQQREQMAEVESAYEIIDGEIVYKESENAN